MIRKFPANRSDFVGGQTYFAGLDRKRSRSFGLIEYLTEAIASEGWLYSLQIERFARVVDIPKTLSGGRGWPEAENTSCEEIFTGTWWEQSGQVGVDDSGVDEVYVEIYLCTQCNVERSQRRAEGEFQVVTNGCKVVVCAAFENWPGSSCGRLGLSGTLK